MMLLSLDTERIQYENKFLINFGTVFFTFDFLVARFNQKAAELKVQLLFMVIEPIKSVPKWSHYLCTINLENSRLLKCYLAIDR